MTSTAAMNQDHRVRVGAERREKTRLRLLETALNVFIEKGPDQAVTEDFISAAGVSRGTFYNHFKTASDLLLDLATDMSDEALGVVDPLVLNCKNPVERFATGTRLYMQIAYRYPLWGQFLRRVGTRIATRGQLIETYLTRDLSDAIKKKLIKEQNLLVARDIVLGSIFYGIETMATEETVEHHPEHIIRCVLIGLGVSVKEAERISAMPLQAPGEMNGAIFSKLEKRKTVKKQLVKNAEKPTRKVK